MPIRKPKPTSSPGRRFVSYPDFAEITRSEPGEVADRGAEEVRRAQLQRTQDLPSPWRRGQTAVPQDRLQAPQGRDPGQGRRDRVRPQPLRLHRAAALRRRREALHPRPAAAGAWERPSQSGDRADIRIGNSLPLARHAARHGRAQRRAHSRAAAVRWRARRGVGIQLLAKEGDYVTLRLPSGEMRLVRAECRATVGTIGNSDHQNVKVGKAGRKRHMGVRPQTRGTAMNPVDHPHGGGEGSTTPGPKPGHTVGRADARLSHPQEGQGV